MVFSELKKAPVFLEIRELRNLQPLQTPLLTIASMNEDCGEFGLQLGIKQQLEKDGYRVSYVGSNRFAPLLGGYVFPQETLESLPCSFEIKIKYLNAWLREIEIRESADLLLLGIPGGTMPIDEYNLNSGGYYAYLAGCAASADFGVLTLPCMEYPPAYFGQCRDVLKHKFNLPADCLCLSNIRITPSVLTEMKITEEKDIFPQDKVEKVMDSYRKKGIFLLNAAKQITYEAITQKLYDKLS